jgi:hypothetical protein
VSAVLVAAFAVSGVSNLMLALVAANGQNKIEALQAKLTDAVQAHAACPKPPSTPWGRVS